MTPVPPPIEVLYRDDDLVVVHKPAGMLVHRTALDLGESRFLLQTLRDQIGVPVHPAHRLDKGTSGVVVFALHSEAARQLTAAFRDGTVEKTYLAVVRGWAPDRCDVDHALRDIADRFDRRQVVESRPARTEIACLARAEFDVAVGPYQTARYSLVECRPRSGRKHQIRRHLKHLRHPVIGDANYGDGAHNRFFRHTLGVARLLLVANALRLPHPRNGDPLAITAPPDDSFLAALQHPNWRSTGA